VTPASEQGQPEGTTVPADDACRLWAAETGHGTPLIMCHGGPGLWDMFGTLAEHERERLLITPAARRGCSRGRKTIRR
jgi:proline iminopeptidase